MATRTETPKHANRLHCTKLAPTRNYLKCPIATPPAPQESHLITCTTCAVASVGILGGVRGGREGEEKGLHSKSDNPTHKGGKFQMFTNVFEILKLHKNV